MNNNYSLQQSFLDMIKEFSISNPNKQIDEHFIYSMLMGVNISPEQLPYYNIENKFKNWESRYMFNDEIHTFKAKGRPFLWFANGEINGNEIKLYIPIDYNHIEEGANQLFDFMAANNIEHQSKIASIIRNDNLVVRVNTKEDAQKIVNFVNSNPYIQEGMIKVNPFLPNYNGIGITMDNSESFNMVLCRIINSFLTCLKNNNRLDLFTVDQLNKYIVNSISRIEDLDLKDICILLSKTTSKNFKFQDFVDHLNNKLKDRYDSNRKRITDPKYYFDQAIMETEKKYPASWLP